MGNRLTEALTSGAKTTTTTSVLTAGTNKLASLTQGTKTTRSFPAVGPLLPQLPRVRDAGKRHWRFPKSAPLTL